jgi:hypothetical protein
MANEELLRAWGWDGELRYELELPSETPSNNEIKGMHFHVYKKTRRDWRLMVQAALKGMRPEKPIEKSGLIVIRRCSGVLDWDNAYGGLKPMLDCLVMSSDRNPDGMGLILDDNPKAMPFPPFLKQEKAKPKNGSTNVLIYELK